jgi:hypothetical protein
MSRCGKTDQLEAAVLGSGGEGQRAELLSHAERCAVCRHELNWLRSEAVLFEQRRQRDEIERLWKGVERRSGARAGGLRRGLLATAAMMLVGLGLGARLVSHRASGDSLGGELQMSVESMPAVDLGSVLASVERGPTLGACVMMTPGVGIACDADLRATFDE